MLNPKYRLNCITIEGSKTPKLKGEYVIDIAEYSGEEPGKQDIAYYQLKHTTIAKDTPFQLSNLKGTIVGFSKRYKGHYLNTQKTNAWGKVSFHIITNRPIAENLKLYMSDIVAGRNTNSRFLNTIKKYTGLKNTELRKFLSMIVLSDDEGDVNSQHYSLYKEINHLLASAADIPVIDGVVALVQKKALPSSNGCIVKEVVLRQLGVTSEHELFPASPKLECLKSVIEREQTHQLIELIVNAMNPIIIHAAGGVGKSIVASQLTTSLPQGSYGVVYDCFGGGKYRNRSEPRHRHRDALIQIVNELSTQGLCDPLIAIPTSLDDDLLRNFLQRVNDAITNLRAINTKAILAIIIDAADNAEIAASEVNEKCFASDLLREDIPDGCRLIELCRTERIILLKPTHSVTRIELNSFSVEETYKHLLTRFPNASKDAAIEFHRLTNNGNPRVQANALSVEYSSEMDLLKSLSPSYTTVEGQIARQLEAAIHTIQDGLSESYQNRVDNICRGLAILPPFVPISIIAVVAQVDDSEVISFVSEFGRYIWITENSVQFRDEPTETWFRQNYASTSTQIGDYINLLKPLANDSAYVAETLPSLLLQAEMYDELISIALSEECIPTANPIEARNIRVYRLQFAFKAALMQKKYADAIKLALRAGEEMAGDTRQMELLKDNIDLIAPLQNEQRVQEIALRRKLKSGWDGSEHVYSAALLSTVRNYRGEAIGYLRSAINWLGIFLESRKKQKKEKYYDQIQVTDDIIELAFAHLNLFGVEELVAFILSWRPETLAYDVTKKIAKRLIDAGKINVVKEMADYCTMSQYMIIAIAYELMSVGQILKSEAVKSCLSLLANPESRIPIPQYSYKDTFSQSVVAFTEMCAANGLSSNKIKRVLVFYSFNASLGTITSSYDSLEREAYLKAISLECVLEGVYEPNTSELYIDQMNNSKLKIKINSQEEREFSEIIGSLLPYYILRTRILLGQIMHISVAVYLAGKISQKVRRPRYSNNDRLPQDVSKAVIEILILLKVFTEEQIKYVYDEFNNGSYTISIEDRLFLLRSANRLEHLNSIRAQTEQAAYNVVKTLREDTRTLSSWYIQLARAVLVNSTDDSAAYFNTAVEVLSRFDEEIVQRWEACNSLAKRATENGHVSQETAYRFIRCAELVGDNVYREKHWDRDGAVQACVKLSPNAATAALSRWRERGIGLLNRQMSAYAREMVEQGHLPVYVGWSLSAFIDDDWLADFATICIDKAENCVDRKRILELAIKRLRLGDTDIRNWEKLKEIALKYSLNISNLDEICSYHANVEQDELETQRISIDIVKNPQKCTTWGYNDSEVVITSVEWLNRAYNRYKASDNSYYAHAFWDQVIMFITDSNVKGFLEALPQIDHLKEYEASYVIKNIPNNCLYKVSIEQYWPTFIKLMGSRLAIELVEYGRINSFVKDLGLDSSAIVILNEGILEGLSQRSSMQSANFFFWFVIHASQFLSTSESQGLLDYGLSRFEKHIDEAYSDGNWSENLMAPDDISKSFTFFIWATLGSPDTNMRWRAAHCVKLLAEENCTTELDELIHLTDVRDIGAFGFSKYPFYYFHARLYFLIALSRVSVDNPGVLLQYADVFPKHAINGMKHVLLQKFSADTALNIEKAFPGTYSESIVKGLAVVCKSRYQVVRGKGIKGFDSPWHKSGVIEFSRKFYHAYDIDRYWFEPLGYVFGISGKQVEDLATHVLYSEFSVISDGSFDSDPRIDLWTSHRFEQKRWHSHGSYPDLDDYGFYLSYHSMLVVAAMLLESMPIIHRRDWIDDNWDEWLNRHLLTRNDGFWLSDRRDPVPLMRSAWLKQNRTSSKDEVNSAIDFTPYVSYSKRGKTWVVVKGHIEERDFRNVERIHYSSALVSSRSSYSLVNALNFCTESYDYKLPDYDEDNMEFGVSPFILKGWIVDEKGDNRLDSFDSLGANISFPPFEIDPSIISMMEIIHDSEKRRWKIAGCDEPCLECNIWKAGDDNEDSNSFREGRILVASLEFLKRLCNAKNADIIIDIQIDRDAGSSSYSNDGTKKRLLQSHKAFIISKEGVKYE